MIQPNPSTTEADARALEMLNLQTRACLEQSEISLKQRLALLFVPENRIDSFIQTAKTVARQIYPDIASLDHTAIIDHQAVDRLMDTIADAGEKNARVIPLLDGPAG